jgi:hypothetical protein
LAVAIGDGDTCLKVAVHVHKTPLVLPLLAFFVVHDLPRLIESGEPGASVSFVWALQSEILTKSTRSHFSCSDKSNPP